MSDEITIDDLENIADEQDNTIVEVEPAELPTSEEIKAVFDIAKTEAKNEATEYVNALAALYLPEEVLDDEYVQEKIQQDVINFTNCIFNLNQTQNTIVAMQSNIVGGEVHPRVFEVLGQLFKTNMDVMKYKKQYMQIMEREYEDFSEIYAKVNGDEEPRMKKGKMVPTSTINEPTISKGTKGILEEIQNRKDGGE